MRLTSLKTIKENRTQGEALYLIISIIYHLFSGKGRLVGWGSVGTVTAGL
jgi:hypothetical protein